MDLFVIRHGVAEPRRDDLQDERRELTPEGRKELARAVRGLGRLGVRFDRLLHSPWLRAVQTAELFATLVDGSTEVTRGLARSPDKELLGLLSGDRAAVVGHEPWLGELVSWLVTGDPGHGGFELEKGAVAWLRGEPRPGRMAVVAVLPPDILRRVKA
jgi:phosphohistidine phosphatase